MKTLENFRKHKKNKPVFLNNMVLVEILVEPNIRKIKRVKLLKKYSLKKLKV
jgi:hypothetical protein